MNRRLNHYFSKKYNFDASRKKEKNTEVVVSSRYSVNEHLQIKNATNFFFEKKRLENLILNWNSVHCKEKPKNADREFQKIDNFNCIGFLETSAKSVYNKKSTFMKQKTKFQIFLYIYLLLCSFFH